MTTPYGQVGPVMSVVEPIGIQKAAQKTSALVAHTHQSSVARRRLFLMRPVCK